MKMKAMGLVRWAGTAVVSCLTVTAVHGATVTLDVGLTGSYILGDVIPGADYGNYGGQAGGDQYMINTLIPMALNSSLTDADGIEFNRSGNSFSPLPLATLSGYIIQSGGGLNQNGNYILIDLVGTSFNYLVAKYDGPNGGAEVWDIASIPAGTTLQLPAYAFGSQPGQYFMTGWGLFNPSTNPPPSVPDGGATALMLGAAVAGLGLLKRRLVS